MKRFYILLALLTGALSMPAQTDTSSYRLLIDATVIDFPQNKELPGRFPSMAQATSWSNGLYDLGFWGIHAGNNALFRHTNQNSSIGKRILKGVTGYALGFAFSKYGSELPIPLGVWAHEEYHRSVLGVNGIASKNGNWLFSRWDGTVYGVHDSTLANLKTENINGLLYSYVAGVHSGNMTTRTNMIMDQFHDRAFYKGPLYLSNALYTWNYFRFAASPMSDSVKVLAPPHENANPEERDYAGSDLNAWIHDMFNPNKPFDARDNFPGGEGENRRIGFSDLTGEEQDYLKRQKQLSLLNFVNPSIFGVNRIRTGEHSNIGFFFQYYPTHFGNDISLVLPIKTARNNWLIAFHNYNNRTSSFAGLELGIFEKSVHPKCNVTLLLHGWSQPENQNFFAYEGTAGGAAFAKVDYLITPALRVSVATQAKTKGWVAGNPYLNSNVSVNAGISWRLI